ncbi:endolytic transglycosylase MltG [Mucilaginibacter mali]|uniref:Endolytic murein transglycosylase n=1 Tax=Mucilaginibacter mali TaxID=2740462 RepID=A0A7D4Q8A3_9SPHI|nr:endolytic transglycosylase MltG [Mucilaginibacter mali]QKJ30651.1 endolytic transglycosylase MltG [Mucilaginibacter mali]
MAPEKQASTGSFRKFIIALVVIIVLALAGTGIFYYLRLFGPNVTASQQYLYIHTGATYTDVYDTIQAKGIVKDTTTFNWAAHNMKYVGKVKPGRYRLKEGMSNRTLIRMLQLGNQDPVTVNFHNIRLKEQFAGFMGHKLESDSLSIIRLLDSADYVKQFGFTTDNVYVMIMPDSYQIYWNTSPEKLFDRMYKHYQTFWTPERKQKAADIGLTPIQVSILASIVDGEAVYDEEMPTIAGLYLNRLHKGMHLEADPTLIFAAHDFTIRRVLNKHKLINSPYNTYMYAGLPPGPIMMPSVNAVKAVLNYKKTDYIYMVAKDDFSNHHNFAVTMSEHLINAKKFQDALDKRNIKK